MDDALSSRVCYTFHEVHAHVGLVLGGNITPVLALELGLHPVEGSFRNVDLSRLTGRFQPGRCVNGIPPDVVGKFSSAYYPRYHRPGVNANPNLKRKLSFAGALLLQLANKVADFQRGSHHLAA